MRKKSQISLIISCFFPSDWFFPSVEQFAWRKCKRFFFLQCHHHSANWYISVWSLDNKEMERESMFQIILWINGTDSKRIQSNRKTRLLLSCYFIVLSAFIFPFVSFFSGALVALPHTVLFCFRFPLTLFYILLVCLFAFVCMYIVLTLILTDTINIQWNIRLYSLYREQIRLNRTC